MAKLFFYIGVWLASLININPMEQADKEDSNEELTQSFKVAETLKE